MAPNGTSSSPVTCSQQRKMPASLKTSSVKQQNAQVSLAPFTQVYLLIFCVLSWGKRTERFCGVLKRVSCLVFSRQNTWVTILIGNRRTHCFHTASSFLERTTDKWWLFRLGELADNLSFQMESGILKILSGSALLFFFNMERFLWCALVMVTSTFFKLCIICICVWACTYVFGCHWGSEASKSVGVTGGCESPNRDARTKLRLSARALTLNQPY